VRAAFHRPADTQLAAILGRNGDFVERRQVEDHRIGFPQAGAVRGEAAHGLLGEVRDIRILAEERVVEEDQRGAFRRGHARRSFSVGKVSGQLHTAAGRAGRSSRSRRRAM